MTKVSSVVAGIIDVLRHVRLEYAVLAIGLYAFSLFIGGVRWRAVLAALGSQMPVGQIVLMNLAAIGVNNVTPSSRIGGEACRIFLMRGRSGLTLEQVTASVLFEKLTELPILAALVLVALPTLGRLAVKIHLPWWWSLVAIAALVAAATAMFVLRGKAPKVARWRARLAACLVGWPAFIVASLCSTVFWLLDVLRLMAVAAACHVALSPPQAATLTVLSLIAGAVPTVGGLGAVEGGLVVGLLSFGVSIQTAAAIAAVEWSISYGMATAAGWLAITWLGGRRVLQAARSAAR